MPVPNLIHPVPVKIRQISRATTHYDHDAREPIQFAARDSTKTVEGQPRWVSEMAAGHERGGALEGEAGYVLFRYVDLEAQGVTLQRGDQIIEIGGVSADSFINRLRPTGHYDDVGGPTMIKAFFVDRQPERQ